MNWNDTKRPEGERTMCVVFESEAHGLIGRPIPWTVTEREYTTTYRFENGESLVRVKTSLGFRWWFMGAK